MKQKKKTQQGPSDCVNYAGAVRLAVASTFLFQNVAGTPTGCAQSVRGNMQANTSSELDSHTTTTKERVKYGISENGEHTEKSFPIQ